MIPFQSPPGHTCAVFGGSFAPLTDAHVSIVYQLLANGFRVLLVPSYRHPIKDRDTGFPDSYFDERFEQRISPLSRVFGSDPRIEISRLEQVLGGESYTLRLLRHIRDTSPHSIPFRFVVGTDIWYERHKWAPDWDPICNEFAPIYIPRPGFPVPPELPYDTVLDQMPISSTLLRENATVQAWRPQ